MPILIQANQLPILSATSIYEISALIFCPILPYPPHIDSGKVWRALAAPVASCGLLLLFRPPECPCEAIGTTRYEGMHTYGCMAESLASP